MAKSINLQITEGGIAGSHPARVELPALVAPATGSEVNTLLPPLVTVACWMMNDVRFEFDSSFVLPEAAPEMRLLAKTVNDNPGCPLSIFGHADPVGNIQYNKKLSGRRARVIYGMVLRDDKVWEELYQPAAGDKWGLKSIQHMLTAVGHPTGKIDGVMGTDTRQAVRGFQEEKGLKVDGDPGKNTRRELFLAYMDFLCGPDFRLTKEAFLAQGKGKDEKGDIQGCSEFNPVLILSEAENKAFLNPARKLERDAANAPNRRVTVFFFRRETVVLPESWPCPTYKEDTAKCELRLWSDQKERLKPGEEHREFKDKQDTFACRFYHGFAFGSPCEDTLKMWVLRILQPGSGPISNRKPVKNTAYVVTASSAANAPVIRGTTDENGILRIPMFSESATMTVGIDARALLFPDGPSSPPAGAPPSGNGGSPPAGGGSGGGAGGSPPGGAAPDERQFLRFTLNAGSLQKVELGGEEAVKQRLYNLGYGPATLSAWDAKVLDNATRKFQRDHSLPEATPADDATKAKLKEMHGS